MDVVSGDFEWDTKKDEINRQKHGVAFGDAIQILESPHLRICSDHSSETRWLAIGEVSGRVIAVIYTQRHGRLRIISARSARKRERENYHRLIEDTS